MSSPVQAARHLRAAQARLDALQPESLSDAMTDPTGAHHDHTHAVYAAAPILAEAVLAVAELHYAVNGAPDWCKECGFRWPCPTARALGIAQRPAGPDGEAGA